MKEMKGIRGTWSKIAKTACNNSCNMGIFIHQKLGKAKVRDMGLQASVEEYIRGLDVHVQDSGAAVVVQVRQTPRRTQGYLQTRIPVQCWLFLPTFSNRTIQIRTEKMQLIANRWIIRNKSGNGWYINQEIIKWHEITKPHVVRLIK